MKEYNLKKHFQDFLEELKNLPVEAKALQDDFYSKYDDFCASTREARMLEIKDEILNILKNISIFLTRTSIIKDQEYEDFFKKIELSNKVAKDICANPELTFKVKKLLFSNIIYNNERCLQILKKLENYLES